MAPIVILLCLTGSVLGQTATSVFGTFPVAMGSSWVHPNEKVIQMKTSQPTPTDRGPVIGGPNLDSSCTTYRVLSVCSMRTINPTYTPPTPLPSNYLWGCPPGKLCQPKNVPPDSPGCNFEVGPPSADYVCSPEECVEPPKLIEQPEWARKMHKYVVTPGYFNLDPRYFNMTFEEAFLWPGEDGNSFFPVTVTGEMPPLAPVTEIIFGPASTYTRTFTRTGQPIETRIVVPNEAREVSAAQSQAERRLPAELKKRKPSGFSDVLDFCHDSITLKRSEDAFGFPLKRRSDLFARVLADVESSNSTISGWSAAEVMTGFGTNTNAIVTSSKPSPNATATNGATKPPMTNAASSSNNFAGPSAVLKACFAFLTGWVMRI
ncbi:hypothetical protein KEM54_005992 [Ascosphaera aggregata]|nr:hypothetical protein KEM54_005992 [Ascosphaera aggregata]